MNISHALNCICPYPEKYVIALTGGIATGKSTVVKILVELGAYVVDTDLIARQVVEPGSAGLREIVKIWGEEILQQDGNLDRKKLAKIIFASEEDRKKLNSLLHPLIRQEMIRQVKESPHPFVFIDVPLLFEAQVPIHYDEVWLVFCSPHQQKERLMRRDQISEEDAGRRISAQLPMEEKRKRADIILENDSSRQEIRDITQKIFRELQIRFTPAGDGSKEGLRVYPESL